MTTKGIDVRQTTGNLSIRAFLLNSSNAIVTTGQCHLRLYELQDSGSVKSYDFNDNTFKYGALTTENSGLTHQSGNNNTRATSLWTGYLGSLGGFTTGGIYISEVEHSSASPTIQAREFQFGDSQGDGLNGIADAVMKRDMSSITGEASRSLLNAIRFLRNKWSISGTTLTVTKEDDATSAWTSALSSSSSGNPITGSDPA
jgi:hypothetical protein